MLVVTLTSCAASIMIGRLMAAVTQAHDFAMALVGGVSNIPLVAKNYAFNQLI